MKDLKVGDYVKRYDIIFKVINIKRGRCYLQNIITNDTFHVDLDITEKYTTRIPKEVYDSNLFKSVYNRK